jgi:hypothetical protein
MFNNCPSLTTLDVSRWPVNKECDVIRMLS